MKTSTIDHLKEYFFFAGVGFLAVVAITLLITLAR